MRKYFLLGIIMLFSIVLVSCNEDQEETDNDDSNNNEHVHEYLDGKCSCGDEVLNTYQVSFYDDAGKLLKTDEVLQYQNAVAPEVPKKEGYEFVGWNQSITNVTKNLSIYPLYEKKILTVIFYDDLNQMLAEKQVEYGGSISYDGLIEKEGYEFLGWTQELSNIKEHLFVKPIFVKKIFTVKFYDGNDNIIEEQVVEYGNDAKKPKNPTKTGYQFSGWNTDITNVKEDLEVYPLFEALGNVITFKDMYGEVIHSEVVKTGEDATAPIAPVVPFYTFKEWSVEYTNVSTDLTITAIYTKNSDNYPKENANYWLKILAGKYNIENEILTRDEIKKYNQSIVSDYSKTKVIDVLKIESKTTSAYVSSLITRYSNINKYVVYNDQTHQSLSSTAKDDILLNRNLGNLSSNIDVKFGIIIDFAWMRSYPTNCYSNDYDMDRFQETSLNVGEGVAIYHESLDGNWYFVQAENYNGWVEKKYVAECSFEELNAFLTTKDLLLVISDYVVIENAHVRMGQTFPLISQTDSIYKISFPTRNSDGKLVLKEVEITVSNNYHVGYLKYSYENIFNQGFKLLGIDYSWGDKNKYGRDCSSTMNAIYKCFGFMMPRNTSNQVAIPGYGKKVSGVSTSIMKGYKPGTLIFTSSHVMFYLGEDYNGNAYLLHNTTSGDGACILQSLDSYGGSRINGILELQ